MTAPVTFKQHDIARVFRAAKAADVMVHVEIEGGKIVAKMVEKGEDAFSPNPCDELLKK